MKKFVSKEAYVQPETFGPGDFKVVVRDLKPESERDNRDTIRHVLAIINAPKDVWEWVIPSYDSGYYKVSDGISAPFKWWRRLGIDMFGLDIHPAGSAHDYGYYHGRENQKYEDKMFKKTLKVFRTHWFPRRSMYRTLRMLGWKGWWKHARRRRKIPGYGTDEHIATLKPRG